MRSTRLKAVTRCPRGGVVAWLILDTRPRQRSAALGVGSMIIVFCFWFVSGGQVVACRSDTCTRCEAHLRGWRAGEDMPGLSDREGDSGLACGERKPSLPWHRTG